MKKIRQFLKVIWRANPKTIYFNFTYLPWQKAIRFPIWVSSATYLRKTHGKILLPENITTGMIKIGYGDIGIFDNKRSRTIWEVDGLVSFQGSAEIGHGAKISVGPAGELYFGKNFALTAESTIIAYKKVAFGNDCLLSWDVLIMDTDFHRIINEKDEIQNQPAGIEIGNHVWIGCRTMVLKGTEIPDNSVIAANSLVSKKLAGNNQVFGNHPLTVLSQNIQWLK